MSSTNWIFGLFKEKKKTQSWEGWGGWGRIWEELEEGGGGYDENALYQIRTELVKMYLKLQRD